MRRWLREATSDSDERAEAMLGMWRSAAGEISKYPLEMRQNIVNFTSQMIERGDSSALSSWVFTSFFKKVLRLLAENPDLTPEVHTRAKEIFDDPDVKMMSIGKLKDHISAALFLLERGRARADAIIRGEPYSSEEKPIVEALLSLMSRIQEHEDFFDDMREEVAASTRTGSIMSDSALKLVDTLRSIHARDPRLEKDSSRRRVVGAITLCYGNSASKWSTGVLVDNWTNSFESRIETTRILRSEEFIAFTQKLESSLSKLHKFQQEKDFEIDFEPLGHMMDCIGEKFDGMNVEQALLPVVKHGKFPEMTSASRDDNTRRIVRLFKMMSRDGKSKSSVDSTMKDIDECVDNLIKKTRAMLDKAPENRPGDPDPIFGRFLFAPERKGEVPYETNTQAEFDAFLGLKDHIKINEPMPQDVALDLMGVLDDGSYSEILHEPKEEYVFRGISMNEEGLRNMIRLPPGEELKESGSAVINRMLKGSSRGEGSSSWSTNLASALEFSEAGYSRPFSVVLVAKRSENPNSFLEGPNGLYKVKAFSSFTHEKESIALGSIRIYKVYWQLLPSGTTFQGTVAEKQRKSESRQVTLLKNFISEVVRRR